MTRLLRFPFLHLHFIGWTQYSGTLSKVLVAWLLVPSRKNCCPCSAIPWNSNRLGWAGCGRCGLWRHVDAAHADDAAEARLIFTVASKVQRSWDVGDDKLLVYTVHKERKGSLLNINLKTKDGVPIPAGNRSNNSFVPDRTPIL